MRPAAGQSARKDRRLPLADEEPFRIVAVGVATRRGTFTVLAGQSLEPVARSVDQATALLVIGYPLLVLVHGRGAIPVRGPFDASGGGDPA